jgi:acyl carrier protein
MSNKIRKKLHAFIIENCESEISSLSDNTPIFESGLFKSVQIMDLILFVEEISGKEIDVEGLKPGAFKDIDTIIKNFVETEKKN